MSCNRHRCGCGNGNGSVEIEVFGGQGGNSECDNDRREYNCRADRRVIKHQRIVKHKHDIIHEYDVIHEHDYHYYDVVRNREIDRHHNHRDYNDDGYCREGNCPNNDDDCGCENDDE